MPKSPIFADGAEVPQGFSPVVFLYSAPNFL